MRKSRATTDWSGRGADFHALETGRVARVALAGGHFVTPGLVRLLSRAALVVLCCTAAHSAFAGGIRVRDEWAAKGRLSLDNGRVRVEFAKRSGSIRVMRSGDGEELMKVTPFGKGGRAATRIASRSTHKGTKNNSGCKVGFYSSAGRFSGTFILTEKGGLKIEAGNRFEGVRVSASMRYGVFPSRFVDDCVYDTKDNQGLERIHIPAEHMFMGLLRGNNGIVVGVWPVSERRKLSLLPATGHRESRGFGAFEVTNAGTEIYLGVLTAPGIWHEVTPEPSWKDRAVSLEWKRPFNAAWKAQLTEFGTPTTYRFQSRKRGKWWRPGCGHFTFPLWFDNGKGVVHFSKKLPPEGKFLIYALEGGEETPYRFLTTHLAPEEQRGIFDLRGTHSTFKIMPNPYGHVMNEFCAGRDELKKAILKVGAQCREQEFVRLRTKDAKYTTKSVVLQMRRYQEFFAKVNGLLTKWRRDREGDAKAIAYLDGIKELTDDMQQQLERKLGGHTVEEHLRLIDEWSEHTLRLTREPTVEAYPEMMEYVNKVNGVYWHSFSREMGTTIRNIFQVAALGCANNPSLIPYARELRDAVREQLLWQDRERTARIGSLLPEK